MRVTSSIRHLLACALVPAVLGGCKAPSSDLTDMFLGVELTKTASSLSMAEISARGTPSESPMPGVSPQVDYVGEGTLTFQCQYDTSTDGNVSSSASECSTLPGHSAFASFDPFSGELGWTPPSSASQRSFEFKISVTDGKLRASRMFVVQVTRTAPSLATSTVSLSSATVQSGSSVTVTLQGSAPSGANLTYGGATVLFVASSGAGLSTGVFSAVTDHGDGTYSATFTGASAGAAVSIGARVQGLAVSTAPPSITVAPGPVSVAMSSVTSSSAYVAAGSAVQVVLTARDAAGNRLPAGGLTVTFGRSGGTSHGTLGATTDNGDGTYAAAFSALAAGTATQVTGYVGGAALTSSAASIQVTPGAFSLSQSTLTVSAPTIPSGSAATITLRAKDSVGNDIATGGLSVAFSVSGGTSTGTLSSVTDNANGTYTATYTGLVSGSQATVNATVGGASVTSAAPTLQVLPGPASLANSIVTRSASSVASGSSVTLTLQVKDAAGNSASGGGLVVAFAASGGTSTGTIASATDNLNGTYTSAFTGVLAGTPTALGATIGGQAITSAAPTVQVTPGPISPSQSAISSATALVTSGATTTLFLQARDSNGNNLSAGGSTVAFSHAGGTSTGSIGATADLGNGTYSAVFTAAASGSATTLGATIGGSPVTGPLPQLTVTPGNPDRLEFYVQPTASTTPMNPFPAQPVVRILDAQGNVLSSGPQSGAGIVLTLETVSGSGALGGTPTMSAVAGVADFAGKGLYLSGGGNFKLRATAAALALNALSSTISIAATTPAISSALPLLISQQKTITAVTVDNSAVAAPAGSGTAATGTAAAPTGAALTPTGTAATLSGTGAATTIVTDSTLSYLISVTGANTPTCTLASPFGSNACSTAQFGLSYSDIAAADITAPSNKLTLHDGVVPSNSLTVQKLYVSRVAGNLSGTNYELPSPGSGAGTSLTMLALGSQAFDSKTFFQSYNSASKLALFSISDAGAVKQEAKTSGAAKHDRIGAMAAFNGALYFIASNAADDPRVFKLTAAGALTQVTSTTALNEAGLTVHPVANRLYFSQKNASGFSKLFYIDASDQVIQVTNLQGNGADDSIQRTSYFNGYVWFFARCATGTCATAGNHNLHRIDSNGNITMSMLFPDTAAVPPSVSASTLNSKLYLTVMTDSSSGASKTYSIDDTDHVTVIQTTAKMRLHGPVFNNQLYGVCGNSTIQKVCVVATDGSLTRVSNVSGYSSVSDAPGLLGADSNGVYFFASPLGDPLTLNKLYRIDASNRVTQVTNQQAGQMDTYKVWDTGYPIGFAAPTGPSGALEFYTSLAISSTAYKLHKIYLAP